jgi:Fic family protein
MSDEYPIDAARFRQALLEQWAMRLTGGLYHLTQVRMAYNSNHMEGSLLTPEQTRYLYETHTITGEARIDDVVEMVNHFRLFDAMLEAVGTPLTATRIGRYHAILKTGTSDADKAWFAVGDWKRRANVVGGRDTTAPALVGATVDDLLARYSGGMDLDDIAAFHHRFESIHPFQDGNGRVGRVIMFEQCLANDVMPFIVLDEDKFFYYRGLAQFEDEPGFLTGTLRHCQDRYYAGFARYIADPGQGAP